MKLKCRPDDFLVEELLHLTAVDGPYALYRLEKTSLDTHEAIARVCRQWNINPRRVSHAGLKDRHAKTVQYITIKDGRADELDHAGVKLSYCGQTTRALQASDICGNRFRLVVRSMSDLEADNLISRCAAVQQSGFANYFDSQRFGSLGESRQFIGAEWCRRNYERALWLGLAEHNRHDNAAEREQKRILREHWGDWQQCKELLVRSHRRSIVTYLVDHPQKFRRAFGLINVQLRGLWLSAFQSAVWNRMLAAAVSQHLQQADRLTTEIGDTQVPLAIWTLPDSGLPDTLPLPSARCKNLSDTESRLCQAALSHYDMQLSEMKVSYPRDRWFSRARRACRVVPQNLSINVQPDDMYNGRQKAELQFELPSGSYATMLIRTLTQQATT